MAGKEKLLGVQYLRAVAALMVACLHLADRMPLYRGYLTFTWPFRSAGLGSGVDIFFVISGFVMYVTAIENQPGRFIRRRIARIVPLYWFLTIVVAILAVASPGILRSTDFSPRYLIESLAFIPYANPSQHGQIFPMLVPGWSLNFEMFFYAIFAAALFCPLRWRLPTMIITIGALWAAGRAFPQLSTSTASVTYTAPVLILFIAGILLGWAYRRGLLRLPPAVAGVVLLAGFAVMLSPSGANFEVNCCAATAMVAGTVALDAMGTTPRIAWLMLLGDASYSLYLLHPFIFGMTRVVWNHLHLRGPVGAASFAVVSLAAAAAAAVLSYRLIERPALTLLTRRRLPVVPAPASRIAEVEGQT
jgi:exopolysaccharide production protein ExoZ